MVKNLEFFGKTVKSEEEAFLKVLKAAPLAEIDYRPHKKSRTAESLMIQLATQPLVISQLIKSGTIDYTKYAEPDMDIKTIAAAAEKNFAQLAKTIAAESDDDWENKTGAMIYKGGKWEAKKYEMAWSFFFDMIHHRGQLSSYLRPMGGKVPSIYGPSADDAGPM